MQEKIEKISTHAPHAECDFSRWRRITGWVGFQLTHPTRSATLLKTGHTQQIQISTHAPHAECDGGNNTRTPNLQDFNSRTPRGVRPLLVASFFPVLLFQLTHPTRSATKTAVLQNGKRKFQLTHPTRSATLNAVDLSALDADFNSRTPRGVRP